MIAKENARLRDIDVYKKAQLTQREARDSLGI